MLNRFKATILSGLATFALFTCAPAASGTPVLDVNLAPLTVTPGQTGATVFGTLTNNSGDIVYINGDSENLAANVGAPGSVNDNLFFLNTPLSLANGDTTGLIGLFTFDILPSAPVGSYTAGTFSVLGGGGAANQGNFDLVGSGDLSLNVTVTPEPSGLTYMLLGFSLLGTAVIVRSVRMRSQRRASREPRYQRCAT